MEALSAGRDPGPRGIQRPGGTHRRAVPLGALIALTLLAALLPDVAGAESRVTLVPASGPAGIRSSVVGHDFGRLDQVTIRVGSAIVGRTRTSRRGSFRASFIVPHRRGSRLRVVSRSGGRRIVNFFGASASAGAPAGEVASRRGRRVLLCHL